MRRIFLLLAVIFLESAVIPRAATYRCINTWGFFGHKRINRLAVFTLPPEMLPFYKYYIEYLTESAVNPDKRRYAVKTEAPRHYIDIDCYSQYGNPFEVIPRKWEDAVAKFGEEVLVENGIIPWHLDVVIKRLTYAFKTKNTEEILRFSADLGHYVGDAHVPLHTTKNYNGQLTGQKGIHGFWESRVPELFLDEEYNLFVGKAFYIESPLDYAWETIRASHDAVDSVLKFEKELTKQFGTDKKFSFEQRGRVTVKVYSKEFSQAYQQLLNNMQERRIRLSIISTGSFWFTAWVNAGKPNLNELFGKVSVENLTEEEQLKEVLPIEGKVREHE